MEQKQDAFEQLKMEICACRLCADTFDHEPRPVFRGKQKARIMQIRRRLQFMYITVDCPLMMPAGKSCEENGIRLRMHSFMMSTAFISPPWVTAIRVREHREIRSRLVSVLGHG